MLTGILTAIGMIVGVLLARSFTTLVHEYGHAMPALLFSKKEVEVYVGSYGDIEQSLVFKAGRLTTYFKFNVLNWKIGMCRHQGDLSILQNIIIVLGGPIASILLSIPLLKWYQAGNLSDVWLFLIPIFVASAIYDLISNMVPFSVPLKLHDGTLTYNDGQQLIDLYQIWTKPPAYLEGINFLQQRQYAAAIDKFKLLLTEEHQDKAVYHKIIEAYLQQKDYETALQYYEKFQVHFPLKTADHASLGRVQFHLKNYDSALINLNKALFKQVYDAQSLAYRGRIFIERNQYQDAFFDLNNAIRMQPKMAIAYAYRGLLHLRVRESEAAEWDLEKAKTLNDQLPIIPLYLGYYWQSKGDFNSNKKALAYFRQAEAMGTTETNMEWLIAEAERAVNF